jgi:hypothetical protein
VGGDASPAAGLLTTVSTSRRCSGGASRCCWTSATSRCARSVSPGTTPPGAVLAADGPCQLPGRAGRCQPARLPQHLHPAVRAPAGHRTGLWRRCAPDGRDSGAGQRPRRGRAAVRACTAG